MYTTLKFGATIIFVIIFMGLFYPMIIFGLEVLNNPYLLPISIKVLDYNSSLQVAVVELSISYQGSIPISDFRIRFLDKEFFVGDLSKGDNKTIKVKIEIRNIEEISRRIEVEFKITKLYTFRIISEGEVIG